jgi:hypothetical protein
VVPDRRGSDRNLLVCSLSDLVEAMGMVVVLTSFASGRS